MTRRLFGDAVINVILNGVVNVITYVLMVLAGRALTKPDYGLYQALLAVLTIGMVISHSVQLTVTRETILATSPLAGAVLRRWFLRVLAPLVALLAGVLLGSPWVTEIVGGDLTDLVTTWGAFGVILFFSIASGVVFGVGKPRTHAFANFTGSLFRLGGAIAGAFFVVSVPAWIAVYAVQFLVAAVLLLWALPRSAPRPDKEVPVVPTNYRALATYVTLAMPFFLDQLLVQIFSASHSGDYAVLMLFAKIGYFASVPLYAVLFPHLVALSRGGPWKGPAALALAAIAMNAVISLGVVIVGPWVIPHFFAKEYSFSGFELLLGAAAIFFYPPAHLGVLAVLAFGRGSLGRFLAPVFIFQVMLFFVFRGAEIKEILWIQLGTMALLFLMTAIGCWKLLRDFKRVGGPPPELEIPNGA